MKSTKGTIVPYAPEAVPADLPDSARRYLDNELHRIAGVLQVLVSGLRLDPVSAAPAKPRRGDIVYADGALWNPGSGEGIYRYDGAAWKFLG